MRFKLPLHRLKPIWISFVAKPDAEERVSLYKCLARPAVRSWTGAASAAISRQVRAARRGTPTRRANHFASASRLIVTCPAPFAKIFRFCRSANQTYDLASRPGKRGVGHRHERWGGERWTRQCPRAAVIAGRILSIRERSIGAQTNGTDAYGKIVWS